MSPDAPDTRRLLVGSLDWLERRCARQARTRPELSALELFQVVAQRYLERADAWFAAAPTREGELARARNLLAFLVMQEVKTADRERARRWSPPPDADGDEERGLEAFPDEGPDLDRALSGQQAAAAIDALPNPTYRLALRAVFRSDRVEEPEFDAAPRAFARDRAEAWGLFAREREGDHPDRTWRQVLAEIMRCTAALGRSLPEELKTAREWLDKTVQRGRAAVLRALAETGE